MKAHLKDCLRQLQLSSFAANFAGQAALAANEGWSYDKPTRCATRWQVEAGSQR